MSFLGDTRRSLSNVFASVMYELGGADAGSQDAKGQEAYESSADGSNVPTQYWDRGGPGGGSGEEQDNWPEDPARADENAELKSEFHVYINEDGRYQMDGKYRDAYKDMNLSAEQLQGAYSRNQQSLADSHPGEEAMYSDIAMYQRAHDPAYLSSLTSEGLGNFMAAYQAWEPEHVIPSMEEGGEPKVIYGCTAQEYQALDAQGKHDYTEKMDSANLEWMESMDVSLEAYRNEPDVQNQAGDAGTGSHQLDNIQEHGWFGAIKEAIASSAIGAWVVDVAERGFDFAKGLVDKYITHKDDPESDKAESMSEAFHEADAEAKEDGKSDAAVDPEYVKRSANELVSGMSLSDGTEFSEMQLL